MARDAPTPPTSTTGLTPRAGGIIAYLFGWVTGALLLLTEKSDPEIRFHAAQSLLAFGSTTLLLTSLGFLSGFPGLGEFAAFLFVLLAFPATMLWIFMMIMAAQERHYLLPRIGELAERWADHKRSR